MAPLSRTSTNGTENDIERGTAELNALNPITTASSTSSKDGLPLPLKTTGRSLSHSLLAATNRADATSRKSSQAQSTHTTTTMDRPSISMPPPTSKPPSERRPSVSIRSSRRSEDNQPSTTSPPGSFKGSEDILRSPMTLPASASTTATDTTSVTTSSTPQLPGLPVISPPALTPNDQPNNVDIVSVKPGQGGSNPPSSMANGIPRSDTAGTDGAFPQRGTRTTTPARSNSRDPRRFSGSTAASITSETDSRTNIPLYYDFVLIR